ncbi:MAG: Ig domain protein group 2 domain protein [Herbinix sp.]|jgi:hypothetical protein|nr:Ig domain protein group 2 domain protein [Herbinix sp.]
MKKNFFKKLSFVLALAMIVSVLAPAAGAFAAKAPKLNASTKYLHLDVEGKNVYDFNISNKVKGWKYLWSSANEDVAEVNEKNGVTTATGAGKTTISVVITDKDGEEFEELTATVYVRDNMKEVKITGTPADGKVKVGVKNDFNRSYVTFANKTKGSEAKVAWTVLDKDGKATTNATIDANGVFVAKVAGEYTIELRAFQSSAKRTEWLKDQTKTSLVTSNVATYKVVVFNAIKEVKAVKTTQLKVTFESPVVAVDKANFTLVNATSSAKAWIKSVTLSDDKTFATVDLYDSLTSGVTYNLTAKVDATDMTGSIAYVKGTPTKIEAPLAQVAKITPETHKIAFTVYDENGLDITADTSVYYETSIGDNDGTIEIGNGVLVYAWVYYINPTTGAQIKTDRISITGSNATAANLTSYTVVENAGTANFTTPVTSVKMNFAGTYSLKVKTADQYGVAQYPAYSGDVKFESLDPQVFIIDATTGVVTPVSVGVGSFRITWGNLTIIKTLEVKAKAALTSVAFDATTLNVSDTGSAFVPALNTATLKFVYKDQYSDTFTPGDNTMTLKLLSGDDKIRVAGTLLDDVGDTMPITANTPYTVAADLALSANGTSVLQLTGNGFSQLVYVNAYKADAVRTGYTVSGIKNLNINSKFDGDANTTDFSTNLVVYSTNAGNFKVEEVTTAVITVKYPDGTTVTGATIAFDAAAAGQTGTYTVTANNNNVTIATATFTVSDTGTKPAFAITGNAIDDTISPANVQAKLDNLDGFTVSRIKYVSSDTSKLASQTAYTSSATTLSNVTVSATVYNLYAEITKVTAEGTRTFEIYLGTFTVK